MRATPFRGRNLGVVAASISMLVETASVTQDQVYQLLMTRGTSPAVFNYVVHPGTTTFDSALVQLIGQLLSVKTLFLQGVLLAF